MFSPLEDYLVGSNINRSSLNKKLSMIREKRFDVPEAFVKEKLREDADTREEKIRKLID